MNKLYVLIGFLVLSVPLLISCVPPTTTPATTTTPITQLQTDVVGLKTQMADKADNGKITALESRISTIEGKVSSIQSSGTGTSGYAKSETYTKAEVNAAVEAAIAALKTNQSWITVAGAGTGTGTSSPTGSVIFTNNPVSIPQIFSSNVGTSTNPWIMTIINQSSTWQYVKPIVQLNVASGQPSSLVNNLSVMTSCGLCSMSGSLILPNNFNFSPSNMATVAASSIIIIPTSGCNGSGEIQIGPGQQQALNVQIQGLTTPNPILWNVSTSISARSM